MRSRPRVPLPPGAGSCSFPVVFAAEGSPGAHLEPGTRATWEQGLKRDSERRGALCPPEPPGKGAASPPNLTRRVYPLPSATAPGGRLRHQRKASRHLLSASGSWKCQDQDERGADSARTPLCSGHQEPTGLGRRGCGPLSGLCAQAAPAWHTQPARRGETSREPPPHCSAAWGPKPAWADAGLPPPPSSASVRSPPRPGAALWASEA